MHSLYLLWAMSSWPAGSATSLGVPLVFDCKTTRSGQVSSRDYYSLLAPALRAAAASAKKFGTNTILQNERMKNRKHKKLNRAKRNLINMGICHSANTGICHIARVVGSVGGGLLYDASTGHLTARSVCSHFLFRRFAFLFVLRYDDRHFRRDDSNAVISKIGDR